MPADMLFRYKVIASLDANLYPYKSVADEARALSINDASNRGSRVFTKSAIANELALGTPEFCHALPSFAKKDLINTRLGSTPTTSVPF